MMADVVVRVSSTGQSLLRERDPVPDLLTTTSAGKELVIKQPFTRYGSGL